MRLVVIRHGETIWTKEERFQGRIDVPLSEEGRRQAELIAMHPVVMSVKAIYSSTLCRAFRTAAIIGKRVGAPVFLVAGLEEMDLGEWEGKTRAEVSQALRLSREPDPAIDPVQGGESFRDLAKRSVAVVRLISLNHPGETVAVVSHGQTIKAMLCELLHLPETFRGIISILPASVSVVQIDGNRAILACLNDVCHLKWPPLRSVPPIRNQLPPT